MSASPRSDHDQADDRSAPHPRPAAVEARPAGPSSPRPDETDTLRRLRRSETLAEVARAVAEVGTPHDWGARAVAAVADVADWSRVLLYSLRPQLGYLELVAAEGITDRQRHEHARLALDGPTLSALAMRRRAPVVLGRTHLPAETSEHARAQRVGAYAVLPLVAHGQVLGTLTLLDAEPRRIDDGDLDFLRAVAGQLATAFDNARLYEDARRREAQARFLTEVTDLLGSSREPQVVLDSVVRRCVGVLGDACGIFLTPPNPAPGDPLTVAAVHHRRPEHIDRIRAMLQVLPFRYGSGLAGAVASSGQPLLLPDLGAPTLHLPAESAERVRRVDARSCIIAPLRTRRAVLGVFVGIATPEPDADEVPAPLVGAPVGGPLNQETLNLASEVCDRAASALENAQLFSAAQSASLWLRTIFNQMSDAVMVLDPQGRVVERNTAAERMFGTVIRLGVSGAGRRDLFDIRHPDGTPMPPEERPSAQVLDRGQPVNNVDMMVVHPDGTEVELSASAAPLQDEQGEILGAVTVLREVTELRRLERAKDSFLSVASHELRTPLTPLKGLTQILLRQLERSAGGGPTVDPARMERYLRTMDGQVDRLAGLVNDLLDVSRIKTGRLEIRPAPVDLVAVTRVALDRFSAVAEVAVLPPSPRRGRSAAAAAPAPPLPPDPDRDAGHRIVFAPAVRSLVVSCDQARIEQVIANLVANALKYSPSGGDVHVGLARARTGQQPEAHMTVTDPGIGIPSAQMSDLFRPFVRLANAPAENFGGLGLGLYIAFDIVERHGGRIWAESRGAGQGTTFHVLLPLSRRR